MACRDLTGSNRSSTGGGGHAGSLPCPSRRGAPPAGSAGSAAGRRGVDPHREEVASRLRQDLRESHGSLQLASPPPRPAAPRSPGTRSPRACRAATPADGRARLHLRPVDGGPLRGGHHAARALGEQDVAVPGGRAPLEIGTAGLVVCNGSGAPGSITSGSPAGGRPSSRTRNHHAAAPAPRITNSTRRRRFKDR